MYFKSARDFEGWLMKNHDSSPGIWVKIAKKHSRLPAPTYDEALKTALCFGWIDSQKKSFDDDVYVLAFTRRRSRSPWSKRNVELSTALMREGRMQPSGLTGIERAMADGRWESAYDGPKDAKTSREFLAALEKNATAKANYEKLNSTNRYTIYYRIQDAKRQETKDRRIRDFVDMLAHGQTTF